MIPTQTSSESRDECVYSMKFHPGKEDLLFIGLENGDIHELNIANGIFTKTFFLNLGNQPSFVFDDCGFFLISFDFNLSVRFFKKDVVAAINNFNTNYDLQLPKKSNEEKMAKLAWKLKENKDEADYFFNDQIFQSFEVQTKGRDLKFLDLKQSMKPITNKPILSLKVFKFYFIL